MPLARLSSDDWGQIRVSAGGFAAWCAESLWLSV